MKPFDIITVIGCGLGGLTLLAAIFVPMSAIQQGAAAAIGIGLGALPYMVSATLHRADRRGMIRRATPAVACPGCAARVPLDADECPVCRRTLVPGWR